MTSKGMSPLRLFAQQSPQKIPKENATSNGTDTVLPHGRHPLCPIREASRNPLADHGDVSPPKVKPVPTTQPTTPRSKKRRPSSYTQSENMDGNLGSASNSPDSRPIKTAANHVGTVKAKSTWQYKQPASHGLELPSTSSLRRSPSNARTWQDTGGNRGENDTGTTPTNTIRCTSSHSVPTTGASKNGSPRVSKITGKPLVDADVSKVSSSCSNAAASPNRSVTRSLRFGVTPSNGSASGGLVNVPGTRGATGSHTGCGGKSAGFMQQPSQHSLEQFFELEEDPTFWKDHNVQVILRTRPINTSESSLQGFNRCVRQENAHTISWIGQPESRFTFDHVAGELVTQEKLFRVAGLPMVENCMAGYNSCMFCYGQTGSGKTHTMLGDTVDLEHRPSENRGMTPRVFEYLFAKIRKDEEARKHEHLKFVCKCSFLEIFNEQITDLLEPTSTNLHMREDGKKGVYVENLSEVEVESVQDVIHLLLLGAANRKVAATNMNRESSRSHSVFTCIIESKWEFESMTNFRFGRLNLVDLAGSERQKNSGAEGERLKEAANINKSLSTLGLVIMILVDVANGKQRHVPYRDSKLTFLLQDSLGGNSKTTMIANISPSTCCALETLSTLKFAQRAKFIRNNAVVNEDASGDVNGLRQEIQELKEELDRIRRQGSSETPSIQLVGSMHQDHLPGEDHSLGMAMVTVCEQDQARCSLDSREFSKALVGPRISYSKLKAMEAILAGALRREQAADLSQKRLVAEIEQLNRLVRQREDDSQCSKMMLRFREDKIKRLESLSVGLLSADTYLMHEKNSLVEELQLIQAKVDRNPELTRFAMENIRLLDKLRRFQEFYTTGEREEMAEEISILRDQLLEVLNSKLSLDALTTPQKEALAPELACAKREIELLRIEADNYRREVEECRKNLSTILDSNSKLARQLDEAHAKLQGLKSERSAQGEELEALRERALDLEAVEWGHAQHLDFISNLKAQLQQSEERAAREASLRSQCDERLKASIQNACDIHAELQETKKALEAAEVFAVRLQSTEATLAASQLTASSAQDALMQVRLEKEDMAKKRRDSLENIEEAALAWRRKESELRNELKEAHLLIKRSSDKERNPIKHAKPVVKEGRFQELNDVKTTMLDFSSPEKESKKELAHHKEVEEITSHDISQQLEEALTKLKGEKDVVEALENQQLRIISELETLQMKHKKTLEKLRKREDRERGLKKWISQLEWQLKKVQEVCSLEKEVERASQDSEDGVKDKVERSQVEGTLKRTKGELETAQALISKFQEEKDSQINVEQEIDIAESETALAIISLQEEIIKLQNEVAAAVQNEDLAKESIAELVAELQILKVKAAQEDSEMAASQNRISSEEKRVETEPLKKEWEIATARLLEHLTEGEHALTEAVHEMDGIMEDSLSQTTMYPSERQFQQVAVQMLEKNKTADFLQMQLQQARDLVTDAERKVQALSKLANDLNLDPCKQSEILQQKVASSEAKLRDLERTSTASSIMLWWLLEKPERMRVELERGSVEVSSLQLEADGTVTRIEESDCLLPKFQNQLDHGQVLLKAAEEEAVVKLSVHNQSLEDLDRHKHELVAVMEDKEQKDVQLVQIQEENSDLHLELVGWKTKFVQLSVEKDRLEVLRIEDGEKWEKVSTVASILVCWLRKKIEVDQDLQNSLGAEFGIKLEEKERVISDLKSQMVINQTVLERGEEKLKAMLDECRSLRLDLETASNGIEQKDLSLVAMRMDVTKLQYLISCETQRLQLAQAKERLEAEGAESGEALEALKQKVSQVEMQLQVAEGAVKEMVTAQEGLAVAQEEWMLEKAGLVAAAKETLERNLKLEQELKLAYDELDKIQTEIYDSEAREFAMEEERNSLVTKLEGKVTALQLHVDTSELQLELREKRMVELDEVLSKQRRDWDAEKETMLLAAQSADDLCFQKDQKLLCVQESLVTLQSQRTEAEVRETSLSQHMEELKESKEESDRENIKLQYEVAISKGQVEDLSLQVNVLGVEIRGQEAALESKLQKVEENVGGAQQQMKLMLAEMEILSLTKEKLEIQTGNLESEVIELLASFAKREEYCRGIQDELEKAHEDKKEIEDLSAAHENKLLEDLEDLHSENAELQLRGEKLADALGNAKNLVMQKEEEIVVLRRNSLEMEMKLEQAQEQLGASTVLMNQFGLSEKGWKSEKDSLCAETKRLKSCMAGREMEFSALQSQKEVLERNLQEVHESEILATLNLAKLQEKFDKMQTQWDIEKEQFSNGLAKVSQKLLETEEKKDACEQTLQTVQEKELTVSENYVTILERIGELEYCWAGERKEMSDHLATLFKDLSDVKTCSQRTQVDLAKARSLLIAADEGIKYLVDINSSIKEENKQLHIEQQVQLKELSHWERYAAELQMTSNHAPLTENRSVAASESLSINKHLDGLKKEVDRMTRETEKLRAQVLDKDSTIFTVQMEFNAAIATGKEVKLELERAVQENKKYEYELTNMIRTLTSVKDEVSWRKGQVEEFESELQRLMKILVETEERMDEAELNWRKEREELEKQKEEAKLDASEKGSEITALWKKFENDQATLQEVEVLVNALVRANEIAKIKALECKTEKEEIFKQSSAILSHLEEEVQLTMSEVERNIQSFGSEIRGMSSIVREDYLHTSVGLHRKLEDALTIQNIELGTAKWEAQSREAASNARLTDVEEMLQESLVDIARLQTALGATEAELSISQEALRNQINEFKSQEMVWEGARKELELVKAAVAKKGISMSCQSLKHDWNSERVAELERLSERWQDLCCGGEKVKGLERSKLESNEMMIQSVAAPDSITDANCERRYEVEDAAEITLYEKEGRVGCLVTDLNLLQRTVSKFVNGDTHLKAEIATRLKLLGQLMQSQEEVEPEKEATSQLDCRRDQLLETVSDLEEEQSEFEHKLEHNVKELELQVRQLETEAEETSTLSSKLEIELEIITTMLASTTRELREKETLVAKIQEELEESHLENAEMLRSSQEIVEHFNLVQRQLDSTVLEVDELKKTKSEEVQSQSRLIAELNVQVQAHENVILELRIAASQLEEQKIAERDAVENEIKDFKSREGEREAALCNWQRRTQKAEKLLDERDLTIASLNLELVEIQKNLKEEVEIVDNQLQESRHNVADLEFERDVLFKEIERLASAFAEIHDSHQENVKHLSAHLIDKEVLQSLEEKKAELKSTIKELNQEVAVNQQRAVTAEALLIETRLEMEALLREVKQKEDLLQGLEFDISLLQESALHELHLKQAVEMSRDKIQSLQQELNLQKDRKIKLEEDLAQKTEQVNQIKNQASNWKAKACSLENELDLRRQSIESLEDELQMVEQNMANALEDASGDLKQVENERDHLHTELLLVTEQLEMAQVYAEERDAVAAEARQVAELSKTHAEEKEEEAKLLGRSVEELESTVSALESQLGILKQEVERQRLMREDMEMELQGLENHIFIMQAELSEAGARSAEGLRETESANEESERKLEEKEREVLQLQRDLENLQISSKEKDSQLKDSMAEISELLLAVERQTSDFQQKLKAGETKVEQGKSDERTTQSCYTSPKSGEKIAVKVKVSGAAFKCIGSGLAQQMSSEIDAERFSYERRIEELEALATARQKEIFLLNTRLAEAESMTHDVLRDLLGVKSDITSVASMLGQQQVQQLAESAQRKNAEADEKEAELCKLRSQITGFIEERESWLEEIHRRQSEMVVARVAAEKLRQRDHALTTELELLKEKGINQQEHIKELEVEVKKLSGQQNLQQRIHHHAKIKEENYSLRLGNEELSGKLRRTELLFARVNDELARYRAAEGKALSLNIDEEDRLRTRLQEAEEGRIQAAQQLISLCTAIMQAAGVSGSQKDLNLAAALDALQQLEDRLHFTEQELSDVRIKTKIAGEKRRLHDIRAVHTPLKSIGNFSLQRTSSPSPAPR